MTTTEVSFASPFPTVRRFYLKKRMMAKRMGELALSSVWHARQEEQASDPLPDGFPAKETLETAGYTAIGDLEGAEADELMDWAGLNSREAAAVVAAYAAL